MTLCLARALNIQTLSLDEQKLNNLYFCVILTEQQPFIKIWYHDLLICEQSLYRYEYQSKLCSVQGLLMLRWQLNATQG